MWFPDDPEAEEQVAGETTDTWFSQVKGFQIYSFGFGAGYHKVTEWTPKVQREPPKEKDVPVWQRNYTTPPKLPGVPQRSQNGGLTARDKPTLDSPTPIEGITESREVEKMVFERLTVLRDVDAATVTFYKACTLNWKLPVAVIVSRLVGGEHLMYLQYVFRDLKVKSINWDSRGKAGSDRPDEVLEFEYHSMAAQYIQQNPDGSAGTKKPTWSCSDLVTTPGGLSAYFIQPGDAPPKRGNGV